MQVALPLRSNGPIEAVQFPVHCCSESLEAGIGVFADSIDCSSVSLEVNLCILADEINRFQQLLMLFLQLLWGEQNFRRSPAFLDGLWFSPIRRRTGL